MLGSELYLMHEVEKNSYMCLYHWEQDSQIDKKSVYRKMCTNYFETEIILDKINSYLYIHSYTKCSFITHDNVILQPSE